MEYALDMQDNLFRLKRDLRLPPDYKIGHDTTTNCIVIYNDVWGFSITPHWCRERSYEDVREHVRYGVNYLIARSNGRGVVSIQLTSDLKTQLSGVPFDKTERWDSLTLARKEVEKIRQELEIDWDAVFGKWTEAQVEAAALVMSMKLRNGEGPTTAERPYWNAIARAALEAADKAGPIPQRESP